MKRNQGNQPTADGAHAVTLLALPADDKGANCHHLSTASSGAATLPAPAGHRGGAWTLTAAERLRGTSVTTVIADDANELPVKRENNTSTRLLFVGCVLTCRAVMTRTRPRTAPSGGAGVVGRSRPGDRHDRRRGLRPPGGGEPDATGEYVEFTTRAATNTLHLLPHPLTPPRRAPPRAAAALTPLSTLRQRGRLFKKMTFR